MTDIAQFDHNDPARPCKALGCDALTEYDYCSDHKVYDCDDGPRWRIDRYYDPAPGGLNYGDGQ